MDTPKTTKASIDPKAREATAKAPAVTKAKVKVEAEPAGKPTLAQLVKSNQRRTQKLAAEKAKRNK